MISFKWINGCDDYSQAIKVRKDVFCTEQHFPVETEEDKDDLISEHLLVMFGGEIIGCGRLLKISNEEYHLGRIALYPQYRGKGFGRAVLNELERKAKTYNCRLTSISAQENAIGFYEKCGYKVNSVVYPIKNFDHIDMVKDFVFEKCKFYGFPAEMSAGIMKRKFNIHNAKKVVISYTTGGYSVPYVNGNVINDFKFTPTWSNYLNRDLTNASFCIKDTMIARWYYLEYDVTSLVNEGENVFSLHIGGGWFRQTDNKNEPQPDYGDNICYCYKISVTDINNNVTEFYSDASEFLEESYVRSTNIYRNETIDGTLFKSDIFTSVKENGINHIELPNPYTVLEKQNFDGDKVKYSVKPKLIYTKENEKLYDLTVDTSGQPVIRFTDDAKVGDTATVIYSEVLNSDNTMYFRPTGGENRTQKDIFIKGDDSCPLTNVFTWRGGQYVKVLGNAELDCFNVVNSDIKVTCDFKSNNKTLNWLFDTYINTQSNNIHSFVPSDCPHRERLGYTGDGQLCSNAVMLMYDSKDFYKKWLQDIADSQDRYNGHIQHTAPYYGGGGGPGGWGGAIAFVTYNFYKNFGDLSVVKKYYYPILNYIEYMKAHSENFLVISEEKGGWCLGDWCAPDNQVDIPESFVNTYFMIKTLKIAIEFAGILNKSEDVDKLKSYYDSYINSFNNAYCSFFTHSYIGGIQGADAFALDLGLGDEKTSKHLAKRYEKLGQFDTGIFGTPLVIKMLFENGYNDLAFKLLTNEKENSFYNMKKQGATTLWENWDGCDSHNHPMFGAVCEYIFTYILGIKQKEDSTGFKEYTVSPVYIKDLKAEGHVTVNGNKIKVWVDNSENKCTYSFSVE